jgi:hypothetical protein
VTAGVGCFARDRSKQRSGTAYRDFRGRIHRILERHCRSRLVRPGNDARRKPSGRGNAGALARCSCIGNRHSHLGGRRPPMRDICERIPGSKSIEDDDPRSTGLRIRSNPSEEILQVLRGPRSHPGGAGRRCASHEFRGTHA